MRGLDKLKGAWCPGCQRRRPWKEIRFEYEHHPDGPRKLMYCRACGALVRSPMEAP